MSLKSILDLKKIKFENDKKKETKDKKILYYSIYFIDTPTLHTYSAHDPVSR